MSDVGAEVVLFDLGGVLVEVAGVGAMRKLAGVDSDEELWRRWLSCDWVRAFERGQCSPEEFASGVVGDWQLDIDPREFLTAFAAWPTGPYEGAEDLVEEVAAIGAMLGCLSNTNSLHWDSQFARWPLLQRFDHYFLSFSLAMVKPDREIFDHVASTLDMEPGRVLFLDDNLMNVEGARAAGFQAAQARGVGEARRALTAAGLLG